MLKGEYTPLQSMCLYSRYINGVTRVGGYFASPFVVTGQKTLYLDGSKGTWYESATGWRGGPIEFLQYMFGADRNKAISIIEKDLDGMDFHDEILTCHSNRKTPMKRFRYKLTPTAISKARLYLKSRENNDFITGLQGLGIYDNFIDEYDLGVIKRDGARWLVIPYHKVGCNYIGYRMMCNYKGERLSYSMGRQMVYPSNIIDGNDTLVLVSNEITALSLISRGIPAFTITRSLYGCSELTSSVFKDKHIILLRGSKELSNRIVNNVWLNVSVVGKFTDKLLNKLIPDKVDPNISLEMYLRMRYDIQLLKDYIYEDDRETANVDACSDNEVV